MSEQQAWETFAASGSIRDYLLYREAKNCALQGAENDREEKNEDQYRRFDTDRTDN